ncbi:hypothetical protein SDC9_210500 [bioreactor metagenome]|uniref:Uncharacterized protein n=1 Tax=bioreactor metagenome TaxID=1076179 RepID=A0A645JHD2_9ZZZZ
MHVVSFTGVHRLQYPSAALVDNLIQSILRLFESPQTVFGRVGHHLINGSSSTIP